MRSFLRTALQNKAPAYVARGTGAIGGLLTPSNAQGQMSAYGGVGTLFAIVNRLANSTAAVDWKLYTKALRPDDERKEILTHPALVLWNKPNPFYSQTDFIETIQQHIDLVGEAFWIVARSTLGFGPPLELWPIRPDRMAPVPDPTEFLKGYVYYSPDGEKVPLGVDDVVQLKMPNPLDPYRGLGPVQSILADLDSERYSAAWNRNFFLNGAEPGGIIEVDRRLDDAEFDELSKRWKEQHQGVVNAHRVAILEQGKWVDRRMSQKDMQFIQLRKTSQDTIIQAFGFPRPLLGITESVNRANAEAAELMYARWLLVPRLERIKDALNTRLLPLFGTSTRGMEFDFCSPVPADRDQDTAEMKAKTDGAKALVEAGYDPEDVLEAVGLPAMEHKAPVTPTAPAAFEARLMNKAELEMATPWERRLNAELASIQAFIKEHE